jgi:hypothetical protein
MNLDKDAYYMFLLLLLLIGVSYFVGLATDINAVTNGLVKLGYVFSGRDTTGKVSGYAGGSPNNGLVQG